MCRRTLLKKHLTLIKYWQTHKRNASKKHPSTVNANIHRWDIFKSILWRLKTWMHLTFLQPYGRFSLSLYTHTHALHFKNCIDCVCELINCVWMSDCGVISVRGCGVQPEMSLQSHPVLMMWAAYPECIAAVPSQGSSGRRLWCGDTGPHSRTGTSAHSPARKTQQDILWRRGDLSQQRLCVCVIMCGTSLESHAHRSPPEATKSQQSVSILIRI